MCTNNIFNEYIACIRVCDWKNIVPWIHYPLKMFIGSRFTLERFCCWMCWEEASKLSICKYINLMLMPVRRTRAWVITSEIHRNTLKRVRLGREQGPRGRKKKIPSAWVPLGKHNQLSSPSVIGSHGLRWRICCQSLGIVIVILFSRRQVETERASVPTQKHTVHSW